MTAPGAGGVGDGGAGGAEGGAPAPGGADPTQTTGGGFVDLQGLDIPPELHSHMERYIKEKVDPHLTRKQQELADLRKPYEAFEGIDGLADVPAEELQGLLEFRQANQTPEGFADWYTNVAERSIEENPEGFEQWWKDVGGKLGYEFDGDGDPTLDDGDTVVEDDRVAKLEQELEDLRNGIETDKTTAQQEQALTARTEAINEQMGPFVDSLGDMPEDEKKQAVQDVYGLALKYGDEAPDEQIPKAIADWQRIKGQGEQGLVARKLQQPEPALNGGGAVDTTDPVKGFDDAHARARERFRQTA